MYKVILVLVIFLGPETTRSQFLRCHVDPGFSPDEGPLVYLQFAWLGALQYIHVKSGSPHFFRVPRVVLITREFVLSSAVDAAEVPEGYALGNVAFGDYERDETECGLDDEALEAGVGCDPAVVVIPLVDVLLHPEYKHFGASNSVALLKLLVPITSRNVAFGDDERDETECGLDDEALEAGVGCDPAVAVIPLVDVLLHPEYKHFGASNSVALLKLLVPITSRNVAFGDDERNEAECGLADEALEAGAGCDFAVTLVPLVDVLLHPEYKHFGASNSVALLKLLVPITSQYVVPACLPFDNNLETEDGRPTSAKFYHVDFSSDVPIDLMSEEKEIAKVSMVPRDLCYPPSGAENSSDPVEARTICTTGCGFHSGAPSMVHEHTGHWSIISLALGGPPCPDPLIARRSQQPRHIEVHPYVPWITAAITGRAIETFGKDDPFGFTIPRATQDDLRSQGWNGHWWMAGIKCYNRGGASVNMFKFYQEIFEVKPEKEASLTYYLEIISAYGTNTVCVKVGMPYKIGKPKIWGLESPEVKIRIPVPKFQNLYRFEVEAWGFNASESSSSEGSKSKDTDYKLRA